MESEAKYRQLIELAQEGVWALDNDSRTVFVNPRMAKMLGYSESEMIGKNLATFLDNPDSDLAVHNLEDCKLGNQGQCEFDFVQKRRYSSCMQILQLHLFKMTMATTLGHLHWFQT